MSEDKLEAIHLFYSWQSDTDKNTNHFFIRDCLRIAIEKLNGNADTDLQLRIDSDTQNVSGTPDITQTIFDKIDTCNIFVADISIINPKEERYRKTPNPNVILELGYAAHRLGWERIICVFNKDTGEIPNDLPFDLRNKRILSYLYTGDRSEKGKKLLELTGVFQSAIKKILDDNSILPITSMSEIQRVEKEHDLKVLHSLLECINIRALDVFFLDEAPNGYIFEEIIFDWENFGRRMDFSDFHIYDESLLSRIIQFCQSWKKSMSYSNFLISTPRSDIRYTFQVKDKQSEQALIEFVKTADIMHREFRDLLRFVKENYLEIDINETSVVARKSYQDYNNEIKKKLETKN